MIEGPRSRSRSRRPKNIRIRIRIHEPVPRPTIRKCLIQSSPTWELRGGRRGWATCWTHSVSGRAAPTASTWCAPGRLCLESLHASGPNQALPNSDPTFHKLSDPDLDSAPDCFDKPKTTSFYLFKNVMICRFITGHSQNFLNKFYIL